MHRSLPFVLLSVFVVVGTVSQARAADTAPPAQVVRPGDRAMSCEALAGEINALAAADAPVPVATAAPKKKRGGFGIARLLGAAAPFVPGVGGMVGGAVMSAASNAGQAAAQDDVADLTEENRAMMRRVMAGPSPAMQRKDRLTTIFEEKRC